MNKEGPYEEGKPAVEEDYGEKPGNDPNKGQGDAGGKPGAEEGEGKK